MRNHDEKIKNIQRSVLPSTYRKSARDERRRIHRAARSRERDALRGLDRGADPGEFDPDFREGRRTSSINSMVFDRRVGDKLGPLTRWAVRTVRADADLYRAAPHEQVAYFESLLPADLIGQHAVFHIEFALRWEFHGDTYWHHFSRPDRPSREERRARVARDAARILRDGRHREVNAALRHAFQAGPPATAVPGRFGPAVEPPAMRLLLGIHDVDAFADEISRYPWVCEVVAKVAGSARPI